MKKSFTLIELLVVIAIIVLVIMIMWPAITKVKSSSGQSTTVPVELKDTDGYEYEILVIDGCEYIMYGSQLWQNFAITHKGNCKNPIHVYRAEK